MARNKKFFILLSVVLILIDQFSKYLIRTQGGFYICNKGIAFGLNVPDIMVIISIIVIILIYSLISKSKAQISNQFQSVKSKNFVIRVYDLIYHLDFEIWIYLIIAGAISNIIDRLYFGCVTDFIDLKFWPVFNLADVYITVGAIMLMLKVISKK